MTAQEFKESRTLLKLTQAKFAELLGYSSAIMVSRKESSRAPVTRQDEIIITHLLAYVVDEFLTTTKNQTHAINIPAQSH